MPHLKPLLKWAGGKRWLVPELLDLWRSNSENSKRLVEPFCGGLSVALGIAPKNALLNDINPHLINFYKCLQHGFKIEIPMEATSATFYENRERFNDLIQKKQVRTELAAQLFYYLNKTDYNGLCRFNSAGFFNVPFGQHVQVSYGFDSKEYKETMQNWKFTSTDFTKIKLRNSDFIYADPPYDVQFTKYSKTDFKWEDQVRLLEWLSFHKGPIVLSNQATDRIMNLYKKAGYKCKKFNAPRMISCDGNRRRAVEVLAVRNLKTKPHDYI